MAAKLTYNCDGCGAVKKDTNHWFLLYQDENSSRILISLWDNNFAEYNGYTHLCGETCVLKRVAALIGLVGTVKES